jgi:hypothetical protein
MRQFRHQRTMFAPKTHDLFSALFSKRQRLSPEFELSRGWNRFIISSLAERGIARRLKSLTARGKNGYKQSSKNSPNSLCLGVGFGQ